jgi:O-methyltransferase
MGVGRYLEKWVNLYFIQLKKLAEMIFRLTKKIIYKIVFTVVDYQKNMARKGLEKRLKGVFKKYSYFTMIPQDLYVDNLHLSLKIKDVPGDVVECGVWRGGMIGGIAEVLGNGKSYYLFDSFEGLPEAKAIDGEAAISWQKNTGNSEYYDNCTAEMDFATKAMNLANVRYECVKGWFNETLPSFRKTQCISLLRLDADWYDSTMMCLQHLFPKVVNKGIILIDDYYQWDGCSKAVHDYLSETKSASRIYTSSKGVAYIIKTC